MTAGLLRSIAAISGLGLLLFAALLQRPPEGLVGIDTIPSASGGCPPSSSQYLKQDDAVLASAISFCTNGDGDTGKVSLKIPADALAANKLMAAGYVDGHTIRLNVRRNADERPVSIVVQATETWTDVTRHIPEKWRASPLEVWLADVGAGPTQWGGIGLRAGKPARQGWAVPTLLLSCLLFGLALLMPVAAASDARAGSGGIGGHLGRRWLLTATATLVVLMLGVTAYRMPHAGTNFIPHPDQVIPVKVLQSMQSHGDLDTDWARADLPQNFLGFRYNFSGYILSSYLLIDGLSPRSIPDDGALAKQLRRLSCWYSALTLAICFLLLARHLNLGYALAGTLAVALVPQLIQDAHYARPEALSTLLFTACFALSTLRPRTTHFRWLVPVITAAACGLLASIKFTYAISGAFAFVAAFQLLDEGNMRGTPISKLLGIAGLVGIAFLAGFAIGAPHAILDPPGYLQGILALKSQYSGGHPPHMSMNGGLAGQAWLISAYYAAVLGVPALLLHATGYVGKRLLPSKFAYAAILVFTTSGFLLQKVFFERNFSLLLPVFIVIAMLGIATLQGWASRWIPATSTVGRLVLATLASLLFALTVYKSMPIALKLSRYFTQTGQAEIHEQRTSFEQATKVSLGAARVEWLPYYLIYAGKYPDGDAGCMLFGFDAYNDDWSARFLRQMPATFRVISHMPSDFDDIPVSTLQAYHSPAVYLFYDERSCLARAGHP
jgi:hypothetical protein